MKISPYAFPAVVGLAGLCWLGARQAEIRELRLKAAMPERRPAFASASMSAEGTRREAAESERARLRRLAAAFRSGGSGWLRTDLHEVEELEAMSREELIAALDELPNAGSAENPMVHLESRLVSALAKIDPEYATRRFGREFALALWAKEDPAAAVAWFEQQVAAGKFKSKRPDGELSEHVEMLRGLVPLLASSDPAAAGRLLDAIPGNQRIDVFRHSHGGGVSAELARVLRAHLPEEDRIGMLTWPLFDKRSLGELGMVEWDDVERYFQQIDATPEERRAGLLAVARHGRFPRASGEYFDVAPEDIDALRAWVAREDPGLVAEATAGALKRVADRDDFPSWVEYAMRLHEAGEGDSVLKALLDAHPAPQHPGLARSLAERLPPGEERERYLKRFDVPEP